MYITIAEFLNRPPQLLHDSSILGHWIKFRADIVSGYALLVPSGIGIEQLRQSPSGHQIAVETSQKAVENLRLLSDTEARSYRFEALANPGDYELTGEISYLDTQVDGKIVSANVRVGSCVFWLTADHISTIRVEEGTWVQFRALELALFDENL